jgi:hypothetical protein
MRKLRRLAVGVLCAAGLLVPAQLLGATAAQAATFVDLTLINGWTAYGPDTSKPQVEILSGIVHLKGAMATAGTDPEAFVLPAAYRPATYVFVPVDMCNGTNGRLDIRPTGAVTVEQQFGDPFSNAQCFTSLDGVSFAKSAKSFTALTLQNGWANAPFGTSNAAVRNVAGVIHFKGAISTAGTNPVAFTLPSAFRPAQAVFVPVDLCNGTNGRLDIAHSGTVTVQAEGGTFSNAQCLTSLDGASFVKSGTGFTTVTLQNGWTGGAFGTRTPKAGAVSGLVHLMGAVEFGTDAVIFTLPPALAPAADVYVQVDLCGVTNGRLLILPDGRVSVQQKLGDPFSNAQCFTSLDGVSFAP